MDIPSDLTPDIFALKVLATTMERLRFPYQMLDGRCIGESSSFIDCIAKAAAVFGLLHRKQIRTHVEKQRRQLLKSRRAFDLFANTLSQHFFHYETEFPEYLLVEILTFCGVMAELALFCWANSVQYIFICKEILEAVLIGKLEDFTAVGGWKALLKMAQKVAHVYDTEYGF